MAELKPCPFCGGINIAVKQDGCMVSGHRYWFITHSMPSRECPLTDSFNWWHSVAKFATKEKAIEAWNRRAEVVHGRWEDGICTMCGYPIPTDSKYDFIDKDDCLFCYHCGAKMDGGNEDD